MGIDGDGASWVLLAYRVIRSILTTSTIFTLPTV